MNRESYEFQLITPCFSGGAIPTEQAEIRASAIRGQLRWWFRVLGGFKSQVAAKTVREQEKWIFGATAGDDGRAGKLMVRVSGESLRSTTRKKADDLTEGRQDSTGYLIFPLRPQGGNDGCKGVFHRDEGVHGAFSLHLQWMGDVPLSHELQALITVFGNLGSLGFRSRRAMGALRLVHSPMSLSLALDGFVKPSAITTFSMNASSEKNAVQALAEWLRSWRQHGRSQDISRCSAPKPPPNRGFDWALRDHDEGVEALTGIRPTTSRSGRTPIGGDNETFRPALGLPIEQRYQSLNNRKAFWDKEYHHREAGRRGKGRFASPVLLRPQFDGEKWRATVIFVDARAWRPGDPVYVNGFTKAVSLDLYDAMKQSLISSATSGGPWGRLC